MFQVHKLTKRVLQVHTLIKRVFQVHTLTKRVLQVPECTSVILEACGYKLVYRGVTSVKGKAPMKTYFLQQAVTETHL